MMHLPDTIEDPDQQEFDLQMTKTILAMPEEIQDRFKAIKCLYVSQTPQYKRYSCSSTQTNMSYRFFAF